MDSQVELESCKSCEKYRCKVVGRRILLASFMALGFVPVSVGMILSWEGEEYDKVSSLL